MYLPLVSLVKCAIGVNALLIRVGLGSKVRAYGNISGVVESHR